MTKVLVLGGGFIGSHLVLALIKSNYDVTIFQRSKPKKNLSKVKSKSVDLTDPINTLKKIKNFDYVINCAGKLNGNNQKNLFITNLKIFVYSYFACILNNIKNYVFISSNNVVSDTYFLEKVKKKYKIKNGYTLAKIFSEFIASELLKNNDISLKIIRPSNVYGLEQKNGAIHYIFNKIKNTNKKIVKLNLNPNILRNYTHVEDCASCIVKLLKIPKNIICNITNDKKISLKKIVEICLKTHNKKIKIKYNFKQKKTDKSFKINNLKKYLFWKDRYNIKSGIESFL